MLQVSVFSEKALFICNSHGFVNSFQQLIKYVVDNEFEETDENQLQTLNFGFVFS